METKRASLQISLQKREEQLSNSLSRVLLLLKLLGVARLPRFVRERVDAFLLKAADGVFQIILQNAFLRINPGRKSAKGARGYVEPRALQAHFTRRAAIGGELRRRLKPIFTQKDVIARIEGFLDLLANKDQIVARLARRFSMGLTSRGCAHTLAPLAIALGFESDAGDAVAAVSALTPCDDALPDTS